ncbi:MAG: acyl carrier protein [Bacteroidales bacterium]|jgi:acyl carrier protein|nr:acyl carrier protein [Bacteroidales bacterium]
MNTNDILTKLNGIAAQILQQSDLRLTPDAYTMDIDGWDSLAHINIINQVEKEFEIKFKLSEFYKIDTIKSFCDIIMEKSAN